MFNLPIFKRKKIRNNRNTLQNMESLYTIVLNFKNMLEDFSFILPFFFLN